MPNLTNWEGGWPEDDRYIPPSFQVPSVTTIDDVAAIAPEVNRILTEARRLQSYRRYRWRNYERFKNRLSRFVGWHARHDRLQSSRIYELAIDELTKALRI